MNTYLDLTVETDDTRKLYQIHLHTSMSLNDEDLTELTSYGTLEGFDATDINYSAIYDFKRLAETMNYIRYLIVNGYTPVGKGTEYPNLVLPTKASREMEQWK